VIFAQSHLISVQSLYPAIEKLVKVVEVVLTPAAGMGGTRSITVGHARFPAIIFPDGREYIATIGSQRSGKKFSSGPDIEVDVLAVAVRSTFTFFSRNLHEALLTSTTDGRWVAATFLHRERRKYDRRNA